MEECVGGDYRISDLGSSNGTFVGMKRLEDGARIAVPLGGGFRVGQVEIVLAKDESMKEPAPVVAAAAVESAAASVPPVVGKAVASSPPSSVISIPPSSAERNSGRLSPAVAERRKLRKQKSELMRWLGVVMTIVLIGFAGFFIFRIVDRHGAKPDQDGPSVEKLEPDEEEMDVLPLGG